MEKDDNFGVYVSVCFLLREVVDQQLSYWEGWLVD